MEIYILNAWKNNLILLPLLRCKLKLNPFKIYYIKNK